MKDRGHDLPLRTRTSEDWARAVLAEPRALLEDHAHLEQKAAANALALLSRWPHAWADRAPETAEGASREIWTRVLTSIAKDEIEHLGLVLRILKGRGGALGRVHRNTYAAALRGHVRRGRAETELLDRLLVSALIEARSCERFVCLGRVAEDDELRRLYRGLEASERGHYRIFLDLAARLPGGGAAAVADAVAERWEALLDLEAGILADQPPLPPRMHGGEPPQGV